MPICQDCGTKFSLYSSSKHAGVCPQCSDKRQESERKSAEEAAVVLLEKKVEEFLPDVDIRMVGFAFWTTRAEGLGLWITRLIVAGIAGGAAIAVGRKYHSGAIAVSGTDLFTIEFGTTHGEDHDVPKVLTWVEEATEVKGRIQKIPLVNLEATFHSDAKVGILTVEGAWRMKARFPLKFAGGNLRCGADIAAAINAESRSAEKAIS